MSVHETHYVMLIHGTWNSPTPGEVKWYESGGAFAKKLARRLEGSPLAGAVWRRCCGNGCNFSWSGDNTHDARLEAAEKLSATLLGIRVADPKARIHLVAHSHGGNIVLKALELYQAKLWAEGAQIALRYWRATPGARDANERDVLGQVIADCQPTWPQSL
jgi:hypothetical protein